MHAAVSEIIFLVLIGSRGLIAPRTNIYVTCYCIVGFTVVMLSMRYTIEESSIIILYCVNCKFSILSAPPCGNHMLLPQCTVHIVILCTRPVSFTSNSVCGRIVTKESEDHQERESSVN